MLNVSGAPCLSASVGHMKRSARIILAVALLFLLAGMIVWAVFQKPDLEIRAVAYNRDTNGNEIVSFVVTNRSLETLPHFAAVTAAQGDLPLYVIEIKTEKGWK